ncbi:MAG: response regulator [Deltaproteobacteria bacterium]|nr:response regulator [Deltaproteobacteria bacterium]
MTTGEQKRVFMLIGLMILAIGIVGVTAFTLLYDVAMTQNRGRLTETVKSQARLMEAIARHDMAYKPHLPGSPINVIVARIAEAHEKYSGFGKTGSFTLARRADDRIVFLLVHCGEKMADPVSVPWNSNLAQPMRRALSGHSGTMVGLDYDGHKVLAAYEPVAILELGIVAKIDLSEIRAPFVRAGLMAGGVMLLVSFAVALLFVRISRPMITKIEDHARDLEKTVADLERSEERSRRMIERNPDAILILNRDGEILFANPASQSFFGRTPEVLVGVQLGVPSVDEDYSEISLGRPDGIEKTAEMRSQHIQWEGEGAFIVSMRDVTERKEAENRIHRLNEALRAIRDVNQLITREKDANRLIQSACEILTTGERFQGAWIALIDENRSVVNASHAGMGNGFTELFQRLYRGEFPSCVKETIYDAATVTVQKGQEVCEDCPMSVSSCADDGALVVPLIQGDRHYGVLVITAPFEMLADEEDQSLFREAADDIAFALKSIENTTKTKSLESQLRQAQKMEAIGTLAGGIAHDFNNILAAILGYSQLFMTEIPDDSPLSPYLQQIVKAGERARDLVKQILTFSRQAETEPIPLQPHLIVKEAIKLLRSAIPTTIDIQQHVFPDTGMILADPTQIHQVVMNLCTNAYQAMLENGGILDITLKNIEIDGDDEVLAVSTVLKAGPHVCLTVKDTGTGIKPDALEHIFDPYFTTKEKGRGTGLGLAVVHGIVGNCKGAILVESEEGKGTTFDVFFPTLEKQTHANGKGSEAPVLGGNERILMVDDEVPIVRLEKQILEKLGYRVETDTNSLEALKRFMDSPDKFDLLITDLAMPNMSGKQLAAEVKKVRPDFPVIICSGFSDLIDEEKAKELGVQGFLLKPLGRDVLARTVRTVLDA